MKIKSNVRAILAISNAKGPSTYQEIVAGIKPAGTSDRWMHSMFVAPGSYLPENKYSLLNRGMLEVVGKRGQARLFAITPKGKALIGA